MSHTSWSPNGLKFHSTMIVSNGRGFIEKTPDGRRERPGELGCEPWVLLYPGSWGVWYKGSRRVSTVFKDPRGCQLVKSSYMLTINMLFGTSRITPPNESFQTWGNPVRSPTEFPILFFWKNVGKEIRSLPFMKCIPDYTEGVEEGWGVVCNY